LFFFVGGGGGGGGGLQNRIPTPQILKDIWNII